MAQVTQLTSSVRVTRILAAPRCSERRNGARTIFAQSDKERSKIVSCENRTSRSWDHRFDRIFPATRTTNPSITRKEWSEG